MKESKHVWFEVLLKDSSLLGCYAVSTGKHQLTQYNNPRKHHTNLELPVKPEIQMSLHEM
jgi:hypothetical protein